MKTAWITALVKSEARVQAAMAQLRTYGLGVNGHFWTDDLERAAWMAPKDEMLTVGAAFWLVLATTEELAKPSVRYGLSMLALAIRAAREASLPAAILLEGRNQSDLGPLPTPLEAAALLTEGTPGWAAKVVAGANRPAAMHEAEYRLGVHVLPKAGQWFEVGPTTGSWAGALVGVTGANIDFHAVGPRGGLPERTTVEYAQKGLKLALDNRECTAWSVRNHVAPSSSYYVRVQGYPDSILFGSYPEGEQADFYRVRLS